MRLDPEPFEFQVVHVGSGDPVARVRGKRLRYDEAADVVMVHDQGGHAVFVGPISSCAVVKVEVPDEDDTES